MLSFIPTESLYRRQKLICIWIKAYILCVFSIIISSHSGFFLFQVGPLVPGKVSVFFFSNLLCLLSILFQMPCWGLVAPHLHSITPFLTRVWDQGRGPCRLGPRWAGDFLWPSSNSCLLTSPHCPQGLSVLSGLNANVCCGLLPWLVPASLSPSKSVILFQFPPASTLSHPSVFTSLSPKGMDCTFLNRTLLWKWWRNGNTPVLFQCLSGGNSSPQGTVGNIWRHFLVVMTYGAGAAGV